MNKVALCSLSCHKDSLGSGFHLSSELKTYDLWLCTVVPPFCFKLNWPKQIVADYVITYALF